ncbi:MAG: class I SAM-dependent methyltransferase [Planctomycetes bacterium]|nr:class I SAM-dependent methyltransferase [Planctomycetota bacterium]
MIEELTNRLRKRMKHLRKWARRRDITCFRLYEKDLPDHPLIIDYYAGHVVVWTFNRKRDETDVQQKEWINNICESILTALDIDQSQLHLKTRGRQRGLSQYEKSADHQQVETVSECGLQFEINLSDYLDIGLFLDHRPLRQIVRNDIAGKDFLNLFCYTGSFTVYAAAAGANSTCSIDLSNTYLEWLQRNLALNNLDEPGKHIVKRGDTIEELKKLCASPQRYHIIVCDPPTFSNSKKNDTDFIVQDQHVELIALCKKLLTADGVLYFSTNFRQFKMADEITDSMTVVDISENSVPEDFRNRRIHYCWRISS